VKSAIYIGQEHIEVIGYVRQGKALRVLDYAYTELPERTMINGNIAEASQLVDRLTYLKLQKPGLFKSASLVIDSTSLSVKEIPVPKLNKRQYMKIIRDELAVNQQDEIVIDYTPIAKKDKKQVLLALSTSKAFLSNYLDVFNEAGIKLEAIRVGLETVIAYMKQRAEFKDKTVALNIVDGISMLSIVFSNGENVFSTRSRLTYENELGILQSVADNYPLLVRFMKSEKLPDIEMSYYLGLNAEQLDKLSLHGENLAGFYLFDGSKRTHRVDNVCHLSFMCAFNENGMNLIESYRNIKKNMREHKRTSPLLALPIIGALIIIAAYLIPTMMTRPLTDEINEIQRYLSDPHTIEMGQQIDEIIIETARISSIIANMEAEKGVSGLYVNLTTELINLIMHTDEHVVIDNFRLTGQKSVTITGSGDSETASAGYVRMLTSSDLIESVMYPGFRYNSGRYSFSIQATLTGGDIEEGEGG
jgi:hypothetical protein